MEFTCWCKGSLLNKISKEDHSISDSDAFWGGRRGGAGAKKKRKGARVARGREMLTLE